MDVYSQHNGNVVNKLPGFAFDRTVGADTFCRYTEVVSKRDIWRRYDLSNTPHYPHILPPDVQERCVRLVQRLELCYGAIDMILTPDGRYVFLEINPSG